jgi:LmbE family N-acetylglucosaminyl deacetylase
VLVVAAHPDDETLGAGGFLHAAKVAGARIELVVATDGEAAFGAPDPELRYLRGHLPYLS